MMIRGPEICHVDRCDRPGCSPDAGCQGHAWREMAPTHYLAELEDLVLRAERDGIVLTVEQKAQQPLRMGNYQTRCSVRRKLDRGEGNEPDQLPRILVETGAGDFLRKTRQELQPDDNVIFSDGPVARYETPVLEWNFDKPESMK
jgi:hypothetical protein